MRGFGISLFAGLPVALGIGLIYAWARSSVGSFVTIALCDLFFLFVFAVASINLAKASRSRSRGFNTLAAVAWLVGMLAPWWALATRMPLDDGALPAHWLVRSLGYVVEAVVIGGLGIAIARESANNPFSESAKLWAEKDFYGELYGHDDSLQGIGSRLKYRGIAALLEMPRAADVQGHDLASTWHTIKATGFWVESDQSARWLTLELISHERTTDGKIGNSTTPIVSCWQLSEEEYSAVCSKLRPVMIDMPDREGAMDTEAGEPTRERPTPIELEAAVQALNAENYEGALAMAKAHCMHPAESTRADAHRICALAQSRMEQWNNAFNSFHDLFQLEPTAFNAIQLATSSVVAGELLRGQAWLDRAIEINTSTRELSRAKLHTHYLSALGQAGEYSAQLPHLDWLRNGYRSLRTTDSHLLWTYGMPFFSEFLERSYDSLKEFMPHSDIRSWYEAIRPEIDEAGRDQLDAHLAKMG